MNEADLARCFWERYHRADGWSRRPERPVRMREVDWAIIEIVESGAPESAVTLLLAIAEAAASEDELGFLGAGLLEDFVRRPFRDIELPLRAAAARSEPLRVALRSVWLREGEDDEAALVLAEICGWTPSG